MGNRDLGSAVSFAREHSRVRVGVNITELVVSISQVKSEGSNATPDAPLSCTLTCVGVDPVTIALVVDGSIYKCSTIVVTRTFIDSGYKALGESL